MVDAGTGRGRPGQLIEWQGGPGLDFFGPTEAFTDENGYAVSPPVHAGGEPESFEARLGTPAEGQGLRQAFELTVTGTAPAITTGPPPTGYAGQPYSFSFAATGAPAPVFTATDSLRSPASRPRGCACSTPARCR